MTKFTLLLSRATTVLFVCTLFTVEAPSQDQRNTIADPNAVRNATIVIPSVEGRSYLDIDKPGGLICGPASSGRLSGVPTGDTRIDLSFGRSRSGEAIGSWAVRNIVRLGKDITSERVSAYLFDGFFTSGTFDAPSASPRIFDLRGTTSHVGFCSGATGAPMYVRIWGYCDDESTAINFEVTNAAGIFARSVFRTEGYAFCRLTAESNINQTLNRH